MLDQLLNNRYRVTARLGEGAMGEVYRATDQQTGQEVAVKVVSRKLALDPEMVARFEREGEALRQLRHPNIVGFVEMFEHAGQHMIVMEYVPGGSLLSLIRQGPLPVERARRIALELCDALTRAHHLHIIHRDLKPENILLAADGTPKLTDFGVARLLAGPRLTGTGTQMGTPYYMAPEAWEGKPLDAQADIWSLGVVLYEMLTGKVPFDGETAAAVMTKVLITPPETQKLQTELPPRLAPIVARMLTRDKAARYQSMREVGLDLERGPAQAATVARRPARRRWLGWIGLAVAWGVVGLGAMLCGFLPPLVRRWAAPNSGTATPSPTALETRPAFAATGAATLVAVTPDQMPGSAAQAQAFAAPLLAAVANRPADFSDDFSDPHSGWSSQATGPGDTWGYEAGGYAIHCAASLWCGSSANLSVPHYPSYILQVEAQFISGDWGNWSVFFLQVPDQAVQLQKVKTARYYSVSFSPDGAYQLGWKSADGYAFLAQGNQAPGFVPVKGLNRLTLVVRDSQMALYMNGEPVALAVDEAAQRGQLTLEFGVGRETAASAPLVAQFDNVKIWELTQQP